MTGFTTNYTFYSWSGEIIARNRVWSPEGVGNDERSHVSPQGPLCAGTEGQLWGVFNLCHKGKMENA